MISRQSRLNLCVKVTCVICSDFLETGEVRGYTIMSVQMTFLSICRFFLLHGTFSKRVVFKSSPIFHNLYFPLSSQCQDHGR